MVDFKTIYARHAAAYHRLVAHEDHRGHLLPALRRICPLEGLEVVEFGAGTGRLTCLLAPSARRVWAFDSSAHMLAFAAGQLRERRLRNAHLAVADNRRLPLASSRADLAIEGWSFGHLVGWYPGTWQAELDKCLREMARVLRPGGVAVLLETLGTGQETPRPPGEGLAAFYALLEGQYGFAQSWVRTDYRFESPDQAAEVLRFFFGDDLAAWVQREGLCVVPECTGIWWRTF